MHQRGNPYSLFPNAQCPIPNEKRSRLIDEPRSHLLHLRSVNSLV
ncbi:MAG: hypothetical protein V7L21_26355 [Nostoc sp.]